MNPHGDDSAHRSAPGAEPESRVAALADVEEWKARKSYPSTLLAGGPVFGVARQLPSGGWELQSYFSGLAPQDARDSLAGLLRALAAEQTTDQAEYLAAADRLDNGEADELTVRGARYRVVRAERFIRMGPDGPEPPRATDPDPAPGPGRSGDPVAATDPATGWVIDPAPPGSSEGIRDAELRTALRRSEAVPPQVREDSRTAARTHPGTLLLPATFMTAEREGRRWRPHSTGTAATPREARESLAVHLRVLVPWQQDLTAAEHEAYKRAADRLDAEQPDELDVAGRHFRIVRVERLVRTGPEGPEGPRPSDLDALPTEAAADRRLPEQGRPTEDDGPAESPGAAEADASTQRFMDLFEAERRRRDSLRDGVQRS
ncbi:DUF5954 family protein [Streptomyces sp. NBC_01190]|uniref:DUF5954 family protein n=1 Tax=Streptomyces sp. NBC_01190 TaxID=2903767 RepID=UPI00386E394B|nr:DUF5954 family protein [Streptomyces sp. NBC_01190]